MSPSSGGVGDAPVRRRGVAGELGADLPHPVAQRDDPVEAGPGEPAQVLGRSPGDVDAPLGHDAHGVGMQRLGVAARAAGVDRAVRPVLEQRLGDLRAGAVAGAQEQHPRRRVDRRRRRRRRAARPSAGVQRGAGVGEQLAAAAQVEPVVGVATVGRAAPGRRRARRRAARARWYETRFCGLPDQRSTSSPHPPVARASSRSTCQRRASAISRRNSSGASAVPAVTRRQ